MRSRWQCLILAAVLFSTACATDFRRDPEFGREAGFAIVGKIADIATTRAGIQQGLVESNPILGPDQRKAILFQAAGTGFMLWYSARLKAQGNVHWKLPLRIWGVISGSAAGWNATLLARDYSHTDRSGSAVESPQVPGMIEGASGQTENAHP